MVRAAYAENIAKLAETALRLKATSYSYIWTSCPTGIFNLGPYIYTLKFFYEIYKGILLFSKIEHFHNSDAL